METSWFHFSWVYDIVVVGDEIQVLLTEFR